jgi:thiol-disulfide isomerase/thioredoxin
MGRTKTRMVVAGLLMAAVGAGFLPTVMAQEGAGGARDSKAVVAELKAANEALRDVMPSVDAPADPAFRKDGAKEALPALGKITKLMGELAKMQAGTEGRKATLRARFMYLGYMTALGDEGAKKELEASAKGADADLAVAARSSLALGNWWATDTDAAAQGKVLDEFVATARANPASDDIAATLMVMANAGAANDDLRAKAIDTIKTCMTGPTAKSAIEALSALQDQQKMMADAEKAQAEAVGKTFAIQGRTSTDGKFDTASLKGKVVLIDFWATWCGPCRAELPHVKETYQKYHGKGFEIVGVSCDMSDEGLNDFTKDNEMPWVQLREKSQDSAETEWHPLAKQYGVLGIPTMFLVDKKGVLRYVDARENLESKVQKLLAESEGAGPAAPSAEGGAATMPAK